MAQNFDYDTRMPGPMSEWPLTEYEQATNNAATALFASHGPAYAHNVRNAMGNLLQAGLRSEERYAEEHILAQVVLLGRFATGMLRRNGDISPDAQALFSDTEGYEQMLARLEKDRG